MTEFRHVGPLRLLAQIVVQQRLLHGFQIQEAGQFAVLRHGNDAGLFGHDQNERVGHLRDADARPVARAQILAQIGVLRQRQHAAGRQDASSPQDDGAVMEGRTFIKDVFQQGFRQRGVQDRAGIRHVLQRGLVFHDDQCAFLPGREIIHRPDDDVHVRTEIFLLKGKAPGRELAAAKELQRSAQFRLEYDDQSDQSDAQQVLQQPVDCVEIEDAG